MTGGKKHLKKDGNNSILHRLGSMLVPFLVLAVLFHEIIATPFYSDGELATARETSVAMALEGDYETALERFEALVDIAPENQKVWADYIAVLIWSGNEILALDIADQNLDVIKAPIYVLDELFEAALREKNFKKAVDYSSTSIDRSENPVTKAITHSRRLKEFYQVAAAEQLISNLLIHKPDNLRLIAEQLSLRAITDPDSALAELDQLVSRNPNNKELQAVFADVASAQAQRGDYSRALKDLEGLHLSNPGNSKIASDYLSVLSWAARYKEAVAVYDQLSLADISNYALAPAAKSLFSVNRLDEAQWIYQTLLSNDVENVNAESTSLKIDHSDQEVTETDSVASQNSELKESLRHDYIRGLAAIHIARDDYVKAFELLDPLQAIKPIVADTFELLGQAYDGQEQLLTAAVAYKNSLLLRPDLARDYLRWFDATERAVQSQGMASYLDDFKLLLPGSAAPTIVARYIVLLVDHNEKVLAQSIMQQGHVNTRLAKQFEWRASEARRAKKYQHAVMLYQTGLNVFPDNKTLQLGLALTFSEAKQPNDADRMFDRLQVGQSQDRALLEAALYHYRRYGNDAKSVGILQQLMAVTPNSASLLEPYVGIILSETVFNSVTDQLIALERVSSFYSNNDRWKQVKAQLLARDEHCEKSIELLSSVNANQLNRQGLQSAAFVARQCRSWELATNFYQLGAKRHPSQVDWVAGHALVLADDGQAVQALDMLAQTETQFGGQKDYLLAKAYVLQTNEQYQQAMAVHKLMAEKWPEDKAIFKQHLLLLSEAGEAFAAKELANLHPQWLRREEWRRIYSDQVGVLVRQAKVSDNDAEQEILIQRASNYLDEYESYLHSNFRDNEVYLQNAKIDRIVVLHSRKAFADVVQLHEQLQQTQIDIPNGVLVKVADAYLYLQQTEQAVEILTAVTAETPNEPGALSTLFYAYLDNNDFDGAKRAVEQLEATVEEQEVSQSVPWQFQLAAMFDAYSNRLDQAQKKLEAMLVQVPNSVDVQLKLATIYRWRGWPTKARDQYLATLDLVPRNINAQVGHVFTLLDLRDYNLAEEKITQLSEQDINHASVDELLQAWDIHNSYELDSRFQYGKGNSDTFNGKDFLIDTHLYSKPIINHYRVYGRQYYSWAKLPGIEGTGRLHRVGVGGQYRSNNIDWTIEMNQSLINDKDSGVSAGISWRVNDHLSFSALAQSYSLGVSLRAIKDGIDGKSLNLGGQYRWNENQQLSMSVSGIDFSDNNQRYSIYVAHKHAIYSDNNQSIALIEQLYFSSNSEDDNRLYFNPDQDLSAGLAVEYRGRLIQQYGKKLSHRLTTGAGYYKQRFYSSGLIWDIDYEQRWQLGETLSFYYGLLIKERVYDGSSENQQLLYGGVNWRF